MTDILSSLSELIEDRKINKKEGSYTNYLIDAGQDKVLKKVGEECTEFILATKNNDKNDIISEMSDLMYHLSVSLSQSDVSWQDVFSCLEERELKEGNLKVKNVKGEV